MCWKQQVKNGANINIDESTSDPDFVRSIDMMEKHKEHD